ncbi:MAG: DNA/RNA non-specific endonuclease [Bacteroidales bacterium]|nr:DNA/RNA non-specific endonuclease [Bacteroidales bacterium]
MRMFRNIARLCAAFLAAAVIFGCGKEDDTFLTVSFKPDVLTWDVTSVFVNINCNTAWEISITDQPDWVRKLSVSSGEGPKNNVILSIKANDTGENRSVEIIVTAGNVVRRAALTQKCEPVLVSGVRPVWLELAESPERTDRDWFCHYMEIGDVRTRNYSYWFDYNHLVSLWVAYPLCRWNMYGSGKRNDSWSTFDPNIDPERQAILWNGYQEGNNSSLGSNFYARGHQCASGDRRVNNDAEKQTYYSTNMTPQIQNGFNSGIWSNLEDKVRGWAESSDTLYVVTGCVLDGAKYYVYDAPRKYNEWYGESLSSKKVTVPTGYYKAVIRYCKDISIGHGGYMGCAVYLDHQVYQRNAGAADSMSIDELEEKLGYDLFVNLPAVVGEEAAAAIEAEKPATVGWWWN